MIIKVILLGICVCILNLLLRHSQGTFVFIIDIIFAVTVAVMLSDRASDYLSHLNELVSLSRTSGKMISCLYKSALICILSKISSDVCKESGNLAVCDLIDVSGRVMLLIIAFPFIESIIKTATAFII